MKHRLFLIKTGAVLLLLAAGFFFAGSRAQAATVPPGVEVFKPGTYVGQLIDMGNDVYRINQDGSLTLIRNNSDLKNIPYANLSNADLKKLFAKYPYLYNYYYNGAPNTGNTYNPYYYFQPTPYPSTVNVVPVTGSGPLTVNVSNTVPLGDFLTGYKGMTVYTYALDTAGTPTCTGACAINWPPVLVTGTLTPGTGITTTGKLETFTRTDGRHQVTYNGKVLYYFLGDKKVGDAFGQGVGGVWYIVKP
jgi:predicted lipoprotein with Yx(FWY)xxD motif